MVIIELLKKIEDPKIVFLVGIGGNGGGGICAARHLANRNYNISVAITDENRLGEIPEKQLEVYSNAGGRIAKNYHLISLHGLVLQR